MAVSDVYLQPDVPDPVLPDEVVLAAARRHVPEARAVITVDESGGEARIYVVDAGDTDLILKTQRPHRLRARTSLEKEVFVLRHLAAVYEQDPLPVPRVHGYGRDGALEFICMSRVAGAAIQSLTLPRAACSQALVELGHVLARIHAAPQAPLLASGLLPGDRSADDLMTRIEGALSAAVTALRASGRAWPSGTTPDEIAAAALRGLPQSRPTPLVALHSNPGPMHTFAAPETGRFTGLIDFGDADISHPAFDLVRWSNRQDQADLLAGYIAVAGDAVDEAFLATLRAVSVLADLQSAARRPGTAERAVEQARRLWDR